MYMPAVKFHRATTLSEAFDLLRRCGPSVQLMAGGTDLLVDLKAMRLKTDHIVSISRISELTGITLGGDGLRIGALATITDLDESPLLDTDFEPIRDATQRMAVRQIRNVATVGGNLASAVPCADLPPILIAMNAVTHLVSPEGLREIPVSKFLLDVRRTALRGSEILAAVSLPIPPVGFGAAYERFGLREGNAIAVASTAASLKLAGDGRIEDAVIALGAVSPIPIVAPSAASIVLGQRPSEDLFARAGEVAKTESKPISDVRGTASFRKDLIAVLVQRALSKAVLRAGGDIS